jgi:hypothetical protein
MSGDNRGQTGDKLGTLGTLTSSQLGTLGTNPLEGLSLSPEGSVSPAEHSEKRLRAGLRERVAIMEVG